MAFLKTILQYAGLGRKGKMANSKDFEPTDILQHRYQDPQILREYLKNLPEKFTDDQINMKVMKDGIAVSLPRKLKKEEIDGALQAFINAERKRQGDEEE